MRFAICAVRDRASGAFARPMFVPAVGAAIRSFGDEVNRQAEKAEENPLFSHPEDFDLFELGEWDDNTGRFVGLEDPRQIAVGKDMANRRFKEVLNAS